MSVFDEKYVDIFKEQSKIFEQEFARHYGYSLRPELHFTDSHAFDFWRADFINELKSLNLSSTLSWDKRRQKYNTVFTIWLHPEGDVAHRKCFSISNYEKQVGRKLVRGDMSDGQDITEFCQNYYSDLRSLLEGELKNILIGKEFIEHDQWCGR